jgi:hypothetical protein
MFGFFVGGEFKGFWSNSVGDVFADLTCSRMNWSKVDVTLVYYPSLGEGELDGAEASVDSVKVYRKESGEDQEELKILVKEIQSDKFMVGGLMLIPC